MKKIFATIPFLLGLPFLTLLAQEESKETTLPQGAASAANIDLDIQKISKSFGHVIAKNLESLELNFNVAEIVKGIQERSQGIAAPMNETECLQAITHLQESLFLKQATNNLKEAETFLETNKKEAGIVEIEAGKLQYQCLTKGTGAVVEPHFSPIIRYVGKFLNGKTFGESVEDEVISLDDTIKGFNLAIVGMLEGEKRRIFIHPELAYGTSGFLPPNSLLTFDIEVVKANAPKAEEETLSSSATPNLNKDELISIDTLQEGIR